jgi:hypothetical protein
MGKHHGLDYGANSFTCPMPSSGSLVSTSVYQVWSAAPDEDDKSVSHEAIFRCKK